MIQYDGCIRQLLQQRPRTLTIAAQALGADDGRALNLQANLTAPTGQ